MRNYLRMRGEYRDGNRDTGRLGELPPHARRILGTWRTMRGLAGTTSACAENTLAMFSASTRIGNYLRMRGEYSACSMLKTLVGELPPHARRILTTAELKGPKAGTTSACAENTRL